MERTLIAVLLAIGLVLGAPGISRAENIGAAGDISNAPGGPRNDEATAALLSNNGIGLVLPLGDTQYECGALDAYIAAYDLTWGRYKAITRAAAGNHEYLPCTPAGQLAGPAVPDQATGADFYAYFGDRACPPPGYCSFDFQGWHFVVLNTTFSVVPGGATGQQLDWFKADLQAHRVNRCTVVYGHHPYKGSYTTLSNTPDLKHYWPTMVLEDVDLYLAGHQHAYERTKPFRTTGAIDYDAGPGDGDDGHAGIRSITVGTGGRSLIPFNTVFSASAFRMSSRYGIFKIVPYPTSFLTAFKGADGTTHDRVSWGCH